MDTYQQECLQAIQVAMKHCDENTLDLDNYKIIEVKNAFVDTEGERTNKKWILTLKRRELLENKSGIIGKGGEVFIEVDLSDSKCKIIRFGD